MSVNLEMNVLIVDDYRTMLRIIGKLLNQIGFNHVLEATDGNAALGLLREKEVGLIISDWNMEPMTGLQLLRTVRADEKLKTTPFIMVAAEGKTEIAAMAKAAGVDNFIAKPFNAETLKMKIASVLGQF
jgi:two-component system chemotaxis response regulator CheY